MDLVKYRKKRLKKSSILGARERNFSNGQRETLVASRGKMPEMVTQPRLPTTKYTGCYKINEFWKRYRAVIAAKLRTFAFISAKSKISPITYLGCWTDSTIFLFFSIPFLASCAMAGYLGLLFEAPRAAFSFGLVSFGRGTRRSANGRSWPQSSENGFMWAIGRKKKEIWAV